VGKVIRTKFCGLETGTPWAISRAQIFCVLGTFELNLIDKENTDLYTDQLG